MLYQEYFFLESSHVKIFGVSVHVSIDTLFLYRFARLSKAEFASYFYQHDVYSKLGGGASWALFDGASWDVLFKWTKMKSFENECNELMIMGIGILCIFHSFPLKKWVREGFSLISLIFKKNACYFNG